MDTFLKIILKLPLLVISIVLLAAILLILFTTVVYMLGYIYDSLFGDWIIKLGHYVGNKCYKIKKVSIIQKIWNKMQPRELYLRYETPMISYCISYYAIFFLAFIIPITNKDIAFIIASLIYIILYFVGMYRKCGKNREYYTYILENNMSFLKLSFLPLGFLITIIGFFCTVLGMKISDFSSIYSMVQKIGIFITSLFSSTNEFMILPISIVIGVGVIVLLYIISVPVQLISYFIIMVINYFREYGKAYSNLIKNYFEIIIRLIGR